MRRETQGTCNPTRKASEANWGVRKLKQKATKKETKKERSKGGEAGLWEGGLTHTDIDNP